MGKSFFFPTKYLIKFIKTTLALYQGILCINIKTCDMGKPFFLPTKYLIKIIDKTSTDYQGNLCIKIKLQNQD